MAAKPVVVASDPGQIRVFVKNRTAPVSPPQEPATLPVKPSVTVQGSSDGCCRPSLQIKKRP
jgi:hypothetical protein